MRQILGRIALATFALALSVSAPVFAQEAPGASKQDQQALRDAARKAYQAIADSKIDDLWVLVQKKYDRKLRPEKLRPSTTGPKVSVAYDLSNPKVLRQGKDFGVVSTNFFKPDSSDIPAAEVQHLNLYMIKEHGDWKIGAPDKKEAAFDGDSGGWYHSGSFTFCPNKGMVFAPNHFSSKTDCDSTAVCR